MKRAIYIGRNKAISPKTKVGGEWVWLNGEEFYKITNSDAMRPFFMSMVSDSNHWMFIASNGALSAGRKDCDTALFPYYTDDKITESAHVSGSVSIFRILDGDREYLWEPFSDRYEGVYKTTRNLYKSKYGNSIVFEEINKDLGISFQYRWQTSNRFGFVRTSKVTNNSDSQKTLFILDGIQNIMPYGVNAELQNTRSNLVDAYKKSELELDEGLGIFALSSIIVDRAEPSESLKATTVWSSGLENSKHLLSNRQFKNFRNGFPLKNELDTRGEKCAYLIGSKVILKAKVQKDWMLVANVNQGPSDVVNLKSFIGTNKKIVETVLTDVNLGTENLIRTMASADGLQLTNDPVKNTRHFANVLFNCMRGGIFDNNYSLEKKDFINYIKKANKEVFAVIGKELHKLPPVFDLFHLKKMVLESSSMDFRRLCTEYLPLGFSRRHGDPSRPWNRFSINTISEIDGSKILDYEGNWRDIFQNWEALAHSYPEFVDGMLFKFLNASTFDGYNPYRVTKHGFDWEVIERDDPWSFIGYWGDHQIIYLLKFLEFVMDYFPNKIEVFYDQDIFVYANVPYKIKEYTEMLKDPKDTILFDATLDTEIRRNREILGADGALLRDCYGEIHKVNFIEKILATVLAKFSNFIPEVGIWLSTQRPEWNDANNALVGNGASMVTLCYLRRFMVFFDKVLSRSKKENFAVSNELLQFFNGISYTLINSKEKLKGRISDRDKKIILEGLAVAGSDYRKEVYANGFSGKRALLSTEDLLKFVGISLQYIDHSITVNRRKDSLYHSYNLIGLANDNTISVSHLSVMLEGQVAVLSSGLLAADEILELLDSLKNSALYRPDQNSYLLYPSKNLPRFMNKNNIDAAFVAKSELLLKLLKDDQGQIVEKDIMGGVHFNGSFNNSNSLTDALEKLPKEEYGNLIRKEKELLLDIFESVFDHKSFTGRSGTFFGYEGLGSIYWHMVSKLVLAVQECCLKAIRENQDEVVIDRLIAHYYDVNEGIGIHKPVEVYGAFPTDPYSHTPEAKGAQQPGMTGQVKEDILIRINELGISVNNGKLSLGYGLLRREEFLKKATTFGYYDVRSNFKEIMVPENALCFTYCQVPVIYKLSYKEQLTVFGNDGNHVSQKSLVLNESTSQQIFCRKDGVQKVVVHLLQDRFS